MEKLNKLLEKVGAGKIFFVISLTIFISFAGLNTNIFLRAIQNFVKIIINIWWVLILVFTFMFLINLLLNEKKISHYVGKNSGIKGWTITIFGGLLSHGPIYLWYPLLSDLKEKGMKNELIASFLYNRAVKIPLIPLMIFYFGIPFTLILGFWIIIFSIINGKIVGVICNENSN